MTPEEIKQYLKDNLRIYADVEDFGNQQLVIKLCLGREVISETTIWDAWLKKQKTNKIINKEEDYEDRNY